MFMDEKERATIKRSRRGLRALAWTGRILAGVILLVAAVVAVLYIPGVLNRIAAKVLPAVEKSTGMKIEAENIALSWPLRLRVDRAAVIEKGDTMVSADRLNVSVNPFRLITGRLAVRNAEILGGAYQMGGADSLYIRVEVDSVGAEASLSLDFKDIAVDHADLLGGRVRLLLGPDSTEKKRDTTATARMSIRTGRISLRNVDYTMSMALTNDTIAATGVNAVLTGGELQIADTLDIKAGLLSLRLRDALYGKRGAQPMAGLDLDWLTVNGAKMAVDSFTMHGPDLRVALHGLNVQRVADMKLLASGVFEMTDSSLVADNFRFLINDRTRLTVNALMGLDSIAAPIRLDAQAEVYKEAVGNALPAMKPLLAPLPVDKPLTLRAVADGTMARLHVDTVFAAVKGIFAVKGNATAANLTNPKELRLNANFEGQLQNPAPLSGLLPKGVKLPPLALKGNAKAAGSDYSAQLTARTHTGRLALSGQMRGAAPGYNIDISADSFPLAAFMPELGVGAINASVKASGVKFNPLQPGAELDADVNVRSIQLNDRIIRGLHADAQLSGGLLTAKINSSDRAADLSLDLTAEVKPKTMKWDLEGDVRNLDFKSLGMTDSVFNISLRLRSEGFAAINLDSVQASATLLDARLKMNSQALNLDSLKLVADAGDKIYINLVNKELEGAFRADTTLNGLLAQIPKLSDAAIGMINERDIQADSLIALLPPLDISLTARQNSVVQQFTKSSGLDFRTLSLSAQTDSALHARAQILGFSSGENIRIDTLGLKAYTKGPALIAAVNINNRPGTLDEFARVGLGGFISGNAGRVFIKQQNLRGDIGYHLGLHGQIDDSTVTVRFDPVEPVIAYKKWQINSDNFLSYNPYTFRIGANVDARGAGSRLQLISGEETDSVNSIALKVSDVHIQDWLQLNPFSPPVAGNVNADVKVSYTSKSVNGTGTLDIAQLTYGRQKVGDFDMELDVDTDFGGAVWANAGMKVNGRRALSINGALNDTTLRHPLTLTAQLVEFPLSIANPFLPGEYARLSGALNGFMAVDGTLQAPVANGSISFENAKCNVGMMGTTFTMASTPIAVDSNLVSFNKFAIYGANANPLSVDGSVNLRNLSAPTLDLILAADGMQFLNSKKSGKVNLYGRGFMDLNATVQGSPKLMVVNASLALLPATNLSYQLTGASSSIAAMQDDDVVKFVNFADTAQVAAADTVEQSATAIILNANLDIRQGSQFTVDLSTDGQNRAQLRPQGILSYAMTPAQPDGRLTGRLNIDGGFFRYSLPVIAEKTFSFVPGSYLAFNGPVANPTLNISATDQTRANVTRQGENSRLVNFDVTLLAKGTPEHLDVSFDLSTADDISLENELQAMSPGQRANQAMNLLLYGIYSSGQTQANANLSGNMLYGFLSSQLNKWAANTIRGVDVSFGFDQFDRTRNGQTSTATQYSYKVSKSLFNDRFKIVVGGNYSTDSEESDIAENLISDVSLEYMLNQSGSMYVRLFRHTGYESILEGEVTQTGVGFVLKRRF